MRNHYLMKGLGLMKEKQIEQALRGYNWMIKEVKRQRGIMGYTGCNLVAEDGIESVMPKPQGETSDPVALEVIRRDKASRWVENLEEKVLFIQQRMHVIADEKEKAVLECMLDGLSMVAIGKHMGLSRRHIYTIKENIVCQIAHFGHKEHFKHNVTSEKQCG